MEALSEHGDYGVKVESQPHKCVIKDCHFVGRGDAEPPYKLVQGGLAIQLDGYLIVARERIPDEAAFLKSLLPLGG